MTPGAQVSAAIDLLDEIETGSRPADDLVADYYRRRRYIGSKDRAGISGRIYTVLRHRASLGWWVEYASGRAVTATPRNRVLASLVMMEGWSTSRIAASCDGDRFRPTPLSGAEQRLLRELEGKPPLHPDMPRAAANDVPNWLGPHLERVFGDRLEKEVAALNGEASVDLRVNLLKTDRDTARRLLAEENVFTRPTSLSPVGLRLRERAPLSGLTALKEGLVEVQDEGSQLAALLAGARPGMRIVDFCAGAGGKTLALAAGMKNRGKLVACDISARRLERSGQRLRRAGISNVERRPLTSERDKWVKRHAGSFDRVFVDAPCLGTGTWRRNPDAKWRASPNDLAELVALQREILNSAARLVRPGGRLLYATCSVLREEDEDQAEAFLAGAPDFFSVAAQDAWHETIGGGFPQSVLAGHDRTSEGALPAYSEHGRYLRLTPAQHGTDGFFVAIFERRADAPPPEVSDEADEAEILPAAAPPEFPEPEFPEPEEPTE